MEFMNEESLENFMNTEKLIRKSHEWIKILFRFVNEEKINNVHKLRKYLLDLWMKKI